MLSAAYTIAHWAEYVSGTLALLALAAIAWRLRKQPRGPVLGPLCVLVTAAVFCAGTFVFLGTRVQQVRLNSIRQVGLETHHAGLRTNALVYDVQASVPVTLRVLPSEAALSGVINKISAFLVHKTTTVHAKVAVYGLIDFATLKSTTATVDRQNHTITVSLPNPAVGPGTTYIASVDGVQVREGPLNALAQSLTGVLDSLLGRPVVSFTAQPALARAKAAALTRARRSRALEGCGKQEITQQLARIFQLTPEYREYRLTVSWPTAAPSGVDCSALQQQLARAGS